MDAINFVFWLRLAAAGLAAYFLGSLNASIIISNRFLRTDIRRHGSGNAGMTNSFRVMGFNYGIVVTVCDLFKGVAAVFIGWAIAGSLEGRFIAAMFVLIGHCFPVFYGFKGGKGVLSAAGAFLVLDWRIGLSAISLFLFILLITKMVSVSSITAAASLFVWALVYDYGEPAYLAVAILTALLLIFMHRSNIKRIIEGTESKVSFKKEKNPK